MSITYKWRVCWHSGGNFGSRYFTDEGEARRHADELARDLGDAEAWRAGVCGVSVSACCVYVPPNDPTTPQSGA